MLDACGSAASRRAPRSTASRCVVTAGGTREPIDPVRFVGNRSSGKMGHAIARAGGACAARAVTLVTTAIGRHPAGVEVVRVETAEEMADAVLALGAERVDRRDGRRGRRLPAQGASPTRS